jgi:hypothetical protein
MASYSNMTWFGWILVALLYASAPTSGLPTCDGRPPIATTKNGTLRGFYLPEFHEDLFLGVPFAQPPLGDLRLRHPVSLNESWHGVRNATKRSLTCPGYAGFDKGLDLGEGELIQHMNVIRIWLTNYRWRLPDGRYRTTSWYPRR